ncbi:MAG: NAD(+) synthase [Oscillospiraceae bacterium]|nr:NAD(+) synthase [Oscillospiraceae bacterium]
MIKDKNFVITKQNVESYAQKIANWIRGEVEKANSKGLVLGMSGGIDCAVVARLCQLADVPVHLIVMPYGRTEENSEAMTRALDLIHTFSFDYHVHDIKPSIDSSTIHEDSPLLVGCNLSNISLARANLRPRERTKYSYQFAQIHDRLVIGTTNLSEYMLGYFTKWGDMADINPVLLLTKTEIYILADFLQIPVSIISAKPSADLWIGQTDEEELGLTYAEIDNYILTSTSGSSESDKLIENKILSSQHKREKTPFFVE